MDKTRYAIGDIHGYFKLLKGLISKLDLKADDELIFLGDYIDRGPNSKKVIDFLIKLSKSYNCIFLRGNHESMMENALKDKRQMPIWLFNGGQSTYESYGGFEKILETHGEFFNALKPYYLTEQYLFVHAGLRPGVALKNQTENDLYWIREEFILKKTTIPQKIIYGHTPVNVSSSPYDDKIGIDTGCAYGGKLTALKLPEEQLIQTD